MNPPQPVSTKAMIAICDILGFSNWIGDSSPSAVAAEFENVLLRALYKAIHHSEAPAGLELPSFEHELVGVIWLSDTLLLFTKENTAIADRLLIECVGWLLFYTLALKPTFKENRVKLRGAIAYGDVVCDPKRSYFFGQPIVDAHQLEMAQDWSGVALTESAIARLRDSPSSGNSRGMARWIVEWDVPCKKGSRKRPVVNWPGNGIFPLGWRMRWSHTSHDPQSEDEKSCAAVCAKFRHTREFYLAHRPNALEHQRINPWIQMQGALPDDELTNEWQQAMEAYRRQQDEEADRP